MKERERYVATGLLVLLLVLWGGFVFHRSPEFPGSLAGGVIGIIAALLMFVPLLYLIIKRVKPLKSRVTRTVSMRTMLTWHIYTGLAAPILALIHSGHRFDSTLGISMTLLMLLVVISEPLSSGSNQRRDPREARNAGIAQESVLRVSQRWRGRESIGDGRTGGS